MKIPLSWINDFVETSDLDIHELRRRLDMAGLEVESIIPIGHPGAEIVWEPDKVLTAEVVAVRPHPNADRLVLAEVDYGGEVPETVVTGAPSLQQYKGRDDLHLKVAFAWNGAVLYDGHTEGWVKKRLKPTKIRGVPSRAMVCSEKELGLAEEQEDIIYLPDETPVGVPLVEVLGDYVLDFDIKGPFGHLQSVFGIAREVAAILDRPLRREVLEAASRLDLRPTGEPPFVHLEIADPDLCPRYTATMIRNVRIAPSPLWMQQRLRRAGMRPINNIVDITNYVMLELGEPLHAFDYARLRPLPGEDRPAIIVRRAREGEQMATLDGEMRTFDGEMLLITDGGGPIAVAGVMGGLESEVEAETRDILLEAANFDFLNIRRTAQKLKLQTESSARFGKRVDPELAWVAAARAAELMAQLAGGEVEPQVGDLYPRRPEKVVLAYPPALADRILGVAIAPDEQARILTALEFGVERDSEPWQVAVPSFRQDVRRPVDLVEEVGRIWGYDRFPRTLIAEALPPLRRNRALEGEERLRDILVGLGLDEVISYSLIDPADETERLGAAGRLPDYPGEAVRLRNPLAPERSQMRRTLLPGMARTARSNLRYLERIAIFEVGHIHYRVAPPRPEEGFTGVEEPRRLAVLLTGPREGRWWQPTDREPLDYFDLKGIAEALLQRLGLLGRERWTRGDHPAFHPGRCATVGVEGKPLGTLGGLHPLVREAFDLPDRPIAVMEWDVEALLEAAELVPPAERLHFVSPYPPIHEDLALVVDEDVPAIEVQRAILKGGYPLVTRALLFDIYRGPQVGEGKKSLAFALTYQSPSKALNEKDAAKLRKRIIKQVKKATGAIVRTW